MFFNGLRKKLINVDLQENGRFLIGDVALNYALSRSPRRKRTIAFSLESPGNIRILAPLRTNIHTIEKIIQRRAGWINRRMGELERYAVPSVKQFADGESVLYLGQSYPLHIVRQSDAKPDCRLENDRIKITLNENSTPQEELRHETRLDILLWYKRQARQEFKTRMDEWADRLGVKYHSLIISNPRRLWGSCSPDNKIRINWRLIMAPPALLDYVIAHELCHVIHKNHSARFWKCLEKVMPDYKERRKLLRAIGESFTI